MPTKQKLPIYTRCPPSPGGELREASARVTPLNGHSEALAVSIQNKTYYWTNDEFSMFVTASSPAEARQMLRDELESMMRHSFQTVHAMALKLLNSPPTSMHLNKVAFIVVKESAERLNRYIHADLDKGLL